VSQIVIDGVTYIPIQLASLYTDANCTNCGKLISNASAFRDGHGLLCPRCSPSLESIVKSLKEVNK